MNIAFFITNHGYGHIMRNIPIIEKLLQREDMEDEIHILAVTGPEQAGILRQNVLSDRLTVFEKNVDYGLEVIPGTLLVDREKLEQSITEYTNAFPELIDWAKEFLEEHRVEKIVTDIVPWVIPAAKELVIPSVLITNFTWVEIYKEYLPKELVAPFRASYQMVDRVLNYELKNPVMKEMLPDGVPVGLVCRPFDDIKMQRIRDNYDKPIVFVSIGCSNDGIEGSIEVGHLPYQFITTSGMNLEGDNVTCLPKDVPDSHNYVAASDFCITKAGWSTVAEILLAGKPMAVLERDTVAEDRMTIEELEKLHACVKISVEELQDMSVVLKRLEQYPFKKQQFKTGVDDIVKEISKTNSISIS